MSADGDRNLLIFEEISDTILEIRKIIQFIEKTFALDMGYKMRPLNLCLYQILIKTFHFLLVKVLLTWYDILRRCMEGAMI